MKSIESLMNEHRVIEHGLALLEKIIKRLNSGERIPADIIRILIRFFREFADKCHHGKEEDSLFPLLESRGIPRIGGPIGVMLVEHQMGRDYIRGMEEALSEIETGEEAKNNFINNAISYIALLRDHIFKEDNILFRMAESVLDQDDDARLEKEFKRIEVERLGPGVHEELIASLSKVEEFLKR